MCSRSQLLTKTKLTKRIDGKANTEFKMIASSNLQERGLRCVTQTEPADTFSMGYRHRELLALGDERRVGKTAKLIDLRARLTVRPVCRPAA
jgi:hypothetical protein